MMLLILSKNARAMKDELNMWILNIIGLATYLYEENEDIQPLYSTYHFIRHYTPVGALSIAKSRNYCKMSSILIV